MTTATSTVTSSVRRAGSPRCDVCPHAVDEHDAIGLRFCRATRNAALDRSCACLPS